MTSPLTFPAGGLTVHRMVELSGATPGLSEKGLAEHPGWLAPDALDAIDVVFCSHLHVDHVRWNTRRVDGKWTPTFPKARYVFPAEEVRFWEESTPARGRRCSRSECCRCPRRDGPTWSRRTP